MLDETFVFLSQPYIGKAYRQTQNSVRQYCEIPEIIDFIKDSIGNNTLNKGVKYTGKNAIKYKYKFNKGSNKKSLSVIINVDDYQSYNLEINTLNNELRESGTITDCKLNKIRKMLDFPIALLTYTKEITAKDIK